MKERRALSVKSIHVDTGAGGTVAEQSGLGIGGAIAKQQQQQASRHGGQEADKANASKGGKQEY